MKNYSLINAIKNIATNRRGHYYGLMIIMAVLAYAGTIITNLGDTPEKALFATILALVSGLVQEGIDYYKDVK